MLTKAKAVVSGIATAALLSASMLVAAPADAKPYKHYKFYHKHHHHHHHGYWNGGNDFFVPGVVGFLAGLALEEALVHHHHR